MKSKSISIKINAITFSLMIVNFAWLTTAIAIKLLVYKREKLGVLYLSSKAAKSKMIIRIKGLFGEGNSKNCSSKSIGVAEIREQNTSVYLILSLLCMLS